MKRATDQPHDPRQEQPLLADDAAQVVRPSITAATTEETGTDDAEEDDGDSKKQVRSPVFTGPAWQGYVFALLPILIILFGAGRETWSKGVAAVLLGAAMLLFPARRKLPPLVAFSLLAALAAPLLAFLPSNWLQNEPVWRTRLTQDWDIGLSGTLTPQSLVTLETWMYFTLCCGWLFWCLSRGFSTEQRRVMLYTLCAGGILLCLLSILESAGVLSIPWWPRRPEWGNKFFGPFANRNHISSLAAITCVLAAACAYDAHQCKSRTWMLFALGLLIPASSIFMNTSRAGIVLLFLGITTWLGTSAMGSGFFKKMTVTVSLVLIISTLLVISSGGLAARLETQRRDGFAHSEGRTVIYLKTLNMVMQAPWIGSGLGNYEYLLPQFAGTYNMRERPIHPESDVLWLLAEGGLLTVLSCLLVLVWLFSATGPWFKLRREQRAKRGDQRLRNAAAITFGLGVVHGLVDVPFHGLGYFAFLTMLAGLALRPRRLPLPAGAVAPTITRLAGVGALVLGVAWLAIAQGRMVFPGTSSTVYLKDRAFRLEDSGAYADALPLLNEAIRQNPMNYRLYHERARVRLQLRQSVNEAMADFSRARALESNDTDMCYREGLIWLDFHPEFAIIPWREILIRWPGYYYSTLLQQSKTYPLLRQPLWNLATTTELKLTYLSWVNTREEFEYCLRSILNTPPPDLAGMESTQREKIFHLWYQLGDQAALIAALETNRKWRDDGWRILAEHYARNSDFQRACQTAVPYLPSVPRAAPGTSTDIPALERAMLYNPTDPRRGIDLFQAQKTQGDLDAALRTLEKVSALPSAPTYIRQEIASIYIMKQDFRRAWEQLREAMQKR